METTPRPHLTMEELEAATTVCELNNVIQGEKRTRSPESMSLDLRSEKETTNQQPSESNPSKKSKKERELLPRPYFYYRDFSQDVDPDPLTPLTPPGRVPNFPAKMHAILSNLELRDIVCWQPHGRAWRILKPREFEIKVIPKYFEHAKFSSFIRQANGWGFRRITQGRDRNAYYHELFLRGLPHLCKNMKRPGVAQKTLLDPDHEPDLAVISASKPIPQRTHDDSILLECTLQHGPKARMPIYAGSFKSSTNDVNHVSDSYGAVRNLTPHDQQQLNAFQRALGASESQFLLSTSFLPVQNLMIPSSTYATTNPVPMIGENRGSILQAANTLAFTSKQSQPTSHDFAAGFAAAAALSQQQLQSILSSLQNGYR